MSEPGIRVALLARAGRARDQLHRALNESGAHIVAEGDPSDLDPAQVATQEPSVYLVSLEPAIEAALGRFDELLATRGVDVMFDDAEVTSTLDGWDLNRWARHLASKLVGSDGLPPVPAEATNWESGEMTLDPGAPQTPAELMDGAKLEDYTADAPELADWVPTSPSLLPQADNLGEGLGLAQPEAAEESADAPGFEVGAEPGYGEMELIEAVRFSSFRPDETEQSLGDLEADVAELAAHLEAFEKISQAAGAQVEPAAPDHSAVERFEFSDLALAPVESEHEVAVPASTVAESVARPSSSRLKLSEWDGTSHVGSGLSAVVILAGLGGPDAVRQLLSSLPEKLKVPVLLYQHLEVGKHNRLVEQLAKISRLPVLLAAAGDVPERGKVTLLPAGMTAVADDDSLSFAQGALSELLGSLSARESMVIVLSGADVQLVPMILAVRDAGGLVLAQDPEVCFDGAAATALHGQGVAVYPALGLAKQVANRWSP